MGILSIMRIVFSLIIVCAFIIPMFLDVSPLIPTLSVLTVASESEIIPTTSSIAPNLPNLTEAMKKRKASYPFRGDPECQNFLVQVCVHFFVQYLILFVHIKLFIFAIIYIFFKLAERNSLPKWALTSFPGSGVTWTRQLIEGVTGIYTGSVYLGDSFPVQPEGFFKINAI